MHGPGIEPGPPAWQARILPLNHPCTGGRRRPTPPQRRWPTPARHCSPLAQWASVCSIRAGDDGRPTSKPGSGHVQDPRARRSRRDPGAAGRRPTRPVPRLLRRPRPPRRCRCRPRGPGADAVCVGRRCVVAAAARRRSSQRPAGSRPKTPLAGWLSGRGGMERAIAGGGRDPGLGLCWMLASAGARLPGAPPPPPRAALRPQDPKAL